jgi:transglutaminase-like putative cysteine protease
MAAPRPASLVTVSRAGLTLGAAIGFARVFGGAHWFAVIALAALLPAAIFSLGERRGWHPWAVLASLGVLGFLLAVLVDDPSETVAGAPSRAALQQLGHDLSNALHVLRSAKVPVATTGAALVLAVVATYVLSVCTELVARRLDAPVGAIGPSVALFVGVAALGSGRWAPVTACYALVVMAYLIALNYAETTARRTWFQTAHHRRSQALAGGLLVSAGVIALAIAVGPTLPGARGNGWINYKALGKGNGDSVLHASDPLISIGDKLDQNRRNQEVFTVRSSQPYRWRVIALDKFSKNDWAISADTASLSHLPGRSKPKGATIADQTFYLSGIDAFWLPAAYRPVSVVAKGASVLPSSSSIYVEKGSLANLTYEVESEIAEPTTADLEAVTDADLADQSRDLALPNDFPQRVKDLAIQVTKDAKTPYDKAKALQSFFQDHQRFKYVLNPNLGTNTDALINFLFNKREGFCEQFAAAYGEMARSIGLPTRVAVGYEPGDLKASDGLWHVTERQAHAWPEVWMGKDIGWYAFEPTPGHVVPGSGQGDPQAKPNDGETTRTTPTTQGVTPPTKPGGKVTPTSHPAKIDVGPPTTTAPRHTTVSAASRAAAAVVTLLALALLALGILVVMAWRRTRRRRHDPDPRRRVLGAWNEALEHLSVAGVAPRPSATAIEFALRQAPAQGAGAAGPPLMDLARLQTAAMYAPDPPSEDEAQTAWQRADAIEVALRPSVSRTDRLWHKLKPRRRERVAEEEESVTTNA